MDLVTEEEPRSGAEVAAQMAASGALDEIFAKIDAGELELTGAEGFIPGLVKAALERGLQAELTSHLGYEKGAEEASLFANSRNGSTAKTVATSVRDIEHHLRSTLGTELSHETISKITGEVLEEVLAWQRRPLEALYPVIYLDALIVKVRDGGHVRNKAAHIAVGVDIEGIKHVLGIWVQASEGAKFWASVCAELANRGVRDVLIVCCDGLTGFPEAIEATWHNATVQTCVVHLIRAATRFVSYQHRKSVAAALKPIYQAADAEAARVELEAFKASDLGQRYPNTVATFENAWERFTPFLAFPPELRRVIYTTNSIESLNFQLRKIIKNRGHFPNDDAVVKLLWLAICNIEDKRARAREKERGKPAGERKGAPRLVEGQVTTNWKKALAQLALVYPDRIEPHL
jgi:putative transposase